MATAHPNPGYGNIVKNMRHYKQGELNKNLQRQNMNEDPTNLEDIRTRAREVWGQPNTHQTSYGDHYKDKIYDMDEQTVARPTSPHRKNKPHPPFVFLSARLHDVPGYHNADTVIGKNVYRVDASLPHHERERRDQFRSKYIGRPSSSAVHQYKTREELDAIQDPVERQATEAWLKLASDKDRDNVVSSLTAVKEEDMVNIRGPAFPQTYRSRTVPSLHRYLREAGAQERQLLDSVYHKSLSGHYRHTTPGHNNYTMDLGTRRHNDLEKTTNVRYVHRSKRGDFLMHPEWPPTMPHHRLTGLSSVDLPYVPDVQR